MGNTDAWRYLEGKGCTHNAEIASLIKEEPLKPKQAYVLIC